MAIDLIRQAKQIQPGLHFIVVSGYAQFEYAQNALKYGVEGYLLKPAQGAGDDRSSHQT